MKDLKTVILTKKEQETIELHRSAIDAAESMLAKAKRKERKFMQSLVKKYADNLEEVSSSCYNTTTGELVLRADSKDLEGLGLLGILGGLVND